MLQAWKKLADDHQIDSLREDIIPATFLFLGGIIFPLYNLYLKTESLHIRVNITENCLDHISPPK